MTEALTPFSPYCHFDWSPRAVAAFSLGRLLHLRRGETLVSCGEEVAHVYYVVEGVLEVRVGTPQGASRILVMVCPGNTFGEMSILDPDVHSEVTVAAAEDSIVRALPARTLLELCEDPEFAADVLRSISRKAKFLVSQVYGLSFSDVRQRMADLLEAMFAAAGKPVLSITQETIAGLVGAHVVTVSNVLREMQDRKAIVLGRHRIVLVDRGRLRDESLGA